MQSNCWLKNRRLTRKISKVTQLLKQSQKQKIALTCHPCKNYDKVNLNLFIQFVSTI